MEKKYDVFISYRRDGGQDTARIIRDELRARGFRVFFDVESLRSGKFNEQLFDRIRECNDFILVCSTCALERCVEKDDWVRQELACALKEGKNVIPVLLRGFEFPPVEALPEDIRDVCYCNGLSASFEHFDAFIDKLVTFLKVPKRFVSFLRSLPYNGRRAAITLAAALALACGLTFALWRFCAGPDYFPGTAKEIACTNRLISSSVLNLSVYNEALHIYEDAVNELIKYTENSSGFQKQWSFDEYALYCKDRILAEKDNLKEFDEMDKTLIQDANVILGEKIDIGDANAMKGALEGCIDTMANSLSYFADLYQANGRNLGDSALTDSLQQYKQIAELDRDSVFYAFNEMLLPVDNPDILNTVKTEYLPALTALYARQDWKTDSADIDSRLDSIYNTQLGILEAMDDSLAFDEEQLQKLENAYAEYLKAAEGSGQTAVEGEQNVEDVIQEMDRYIALLENRKIIESILYNDKEGVSEFYDEHLDKLKASRDSLADKYEKVQAMEEELSGKQEKLQALKEEAKEKFKPLETDAPETLWGKALRFIMLKMPDMAGECFDMYAEAEGSEEASVYAENAKLFVGNMEKTGVTGGSIVCMYEEGLPHQAFQIGDILYAVNGQTVSTVEEFMTVRDEKDASVSVLRFQEDGSFEKLELPYDASLGRVAQLSLNETADET